jgi:hypothetical protein
MAGNADAGLELRLERDRGAFVLANVDQVGKARGPVLGRLNNA